MLRRKPNGQKAVEVIVYIATQTQDLFHIVKVMYFADKKHLARYGRFILGDRYIAMEDGPVPSGLYGIFRYARGDRVFTFEAPTSGAFRMEDDETVVPLREPDTTWLSQSEIECIDESLAENAHLSYDELWEKSKDGAWWRVPQGAEISLVDIARDLPDSKALVDYLLS